MQDFIAYIRTISELSEPAQDALKSITVPVEFRKGEFLLEEGRICSSIYFISQGYCRSFYEKVGEDINSGFFFENDFATNTKSLTGGLPSEYSIQACEAVQAYKINKQDLLGLYRQLPEIESFGRKLLELMLARQEAHADLFKLFSAQERYNYLLTHQPMLLQRVPLSQVASYLGIKRETLSRIRNKSRTA